MKKHLLLSVALFSLPLATPSFAMAQDTDQDNLVANADEVNKQVRILPSWRDEYMIVIGKKRTHPDFYTGAKEKVDLDAPVTIPLSGAEILNQGKAAYVQQNSGLEHLTAIRSPILNGGAGAGSIIYQIEGVPMRAKGFGNVNGLLDAPFAFANMVDVGVGPFGSLQGGDAVHGVVNIGIDPTKQWAAQSSFADGLQDVSLMANSEFGDYHDAGFSLRHQNGFRDESGFDVQQGFYRNNFHLGNWQHKSLVLASNINQETAGFIRGVDAYKDEDLRQSNPNPEAFRDFKSLRVQHAAVHSGQVYEVTLKPYARLIEMDFLQHFLPSKALEETKEQSIGLQAFTRLTAPIDKWGFVLGADMELTDFDLREFQERPTIFSYTQGLHYDYTVKARNLSVYGYGNYDLSERATLTIGADLGHIHYDYTNHTDTGIVGRFLRQADRDDSFTTFSPKIGLNQRFYGDVDGNHYLNIAYGARPPESSDLYRLQRNQNIADIEPETTRSIEYGGRFALGHQIDLSYALFHMDKENYFFRDADGFNVVDGETRHQGIELGLNADLDKVELSFGGSYAEHTYQFDRPVTANSTESIRKGDEIDSAPKWRGKASMTLPLNEIFSTTATQQIKLDVEYLGDYYTDASNSHEYDGHTLAHLSYHRELDAGLSLNAKVQNLFDTRHATRADFAFGTHRYMPDNGRILTLQLSKEF